MTYIFFASEPKKKYTRKERKPASVQITETTKLPSVFKLNRHSKRNHWYFRADDIPSSEDEEEMLQKWKKHHDLDYVDELVNLKED